MANDIGAAAHDRRVAQDLELLRPPPPSWTGAAGPDGAAAAAADLVVVGAGMHGIAAAAPWR